jgi:hypothetical protein
MVLENQKLYTLDTLMNTQSHLLYSYFINDSEYQKLLHI